MSTNAQTQSAKSTGWLRPTLFRVAAVIVGLSPLLASEFVLLLGDWGRPEDQGDPFVGFSAVYPLFMLDESGERYETSPTRLEYFRPQSFAAEKDLREFRIFCLGGSTVLGHPWRVETSFTTWLRLSLSAADPDRNWQVINCGGISYASYRLAPILSELLDYQPDLVVIFDGYNEFLEDRTYGPIKRTPQWIATGHSALSHLRTYNALRSAWLDMTDSASSEPPDRPELTAEVDALLDYHGGLAEYHRDDAWRQDVVEHFEYNLRRMIGMAHRAGVGVIVVNPVSNLKDCPPFKYQPSDDLSAKERRRFEDLWDKAKGLAGTQFDQQCRLLDEAIGIDDRHAGVHFHLGKCYLALGKVDEAKAAFVRAKEEDICPLRVIEPLHGAILRVADEMQVPLVDVRKLFEEHPSSHGILGAPLMVDHAHPSIHGHQLVAAALLEQLQRQGIVSAAPGWEAQRDSAYRRHLESLDFLYFARGEQTLERQQGWTEGRAVKVRGPEPLLSP